MQNAGIIFNLSPLDNSVIPGVSDNGPFHNDVLLAFNYIIDDKSF
jgi:hypothetical protein